MSRGGDLFKAVLPKAFADSTEPVFDDDNLSLMDELLDLE